MFEESKSLMEVKGEGGHPARKRKKGREDGPNIVISSSYK